MNDEDRPKKARRTLTIEEKIAHLRGQARARVAKLAKKRDELLAACKLIEEEHEKAVADLEKLGGGE